MPPPQEGSEAHARGLPVVDGYEHVCITAYRYKEDNNIGEPVFGTYAPKASDGEEYSLLRVEPFWRTSQLKDLPDHFELRL